MTYPPLAAVTLDARHPVVFLPVRLETRFRRGTVPGQPDAAGELLVRIYPDSILADSHEPVLTDNEVAAGQGYWRRAVREGDERAAWTALLTRARPERAAWIVDQTKPTTVDSDGPRFAVLETRGENWHRAPSAPTLPGRWVVSAFRGGQRVRLAVSEAVADGLALTPRLSGDPATDGQVDLSGDGLTVEPALRWVYDVDEAVRVGMAVRIPVTQADLDQGFSAVLVTGVRTEGTAPQQAALLGRLLTAHRFSRGLSLVAQGTRTNNTAERASDYPPADPAGAVSFTVARGPGRATAGTDGFRLAQALGLDPSIVDHIGGAGRDEQAAARAMVEALWPATVGYFLDQLLAPEISGSTVDTVRGWMRDWVRPRGPLPALRIGSVPYGVLPVAAYSTWSDRPAEGIPARLSGLLARLATIASALTATAPHLGRTGDAERDLVELLGMDASSRTARIRRGFGYDTTWNAFGFTGRDMAAWEQAQRRLGQAILTPLGEAGRDPRALYLSFTGRADDFGGPMVAEAPLSATEPLTVDYLAWLGAASPATLRTQAPPGGANALLYLMIRHALLAEYDRAARRLLADRGLLLAHESREPELVGIIPDQLPGHRPPPVRTAWQRLAERVDQITGDRSLGDFLADPRAGSTRPEVRAVIADLTAYRDALAALEGLPTAELDRLFTETLDAASHRLDAWITSLATRRLAALRDPAGPDEPAPPAGVWLGCYGWVVGLRADPPAPQVEVTLPDGSTTLARTDSDGFVAAPSMLHAATAAVLRSAYLTRRGPAQRQYAVDLSSRRVRRALALLDAVRDGQPLGAVLGYQFERGLHEGHPGVELDRFIDTFRGRWPAVANRTEPSGEPAEAVAARSVVDGLRVLRAWQDDQIPWGTGGLTPTANQRDALVAELAALDDAVDALGDLLLGESVYQLLKGSPGGAAASLDTLAKGQRPPEPEIVTTPRGGTVLHQRVVLLLGEPTPAWTTVAATPRSTVAPEVDAWLGGLLGDPAGIGCVVVTGGGEHHQVSLVEVGLRPVDLLSEVAGSGARLRQRVAAAAGVDDVVTVDLDDAGSAGISLAAAGEMIAAAGRVLGYGRALAPADLLPVNAPGDAQAATADTMDGELTARAEIARQALADARTALDTAGPDIASLRAALRGAAAVGVPGAFPSGRADDPRLRETLTAQAAQAIQDLAARATAASAADTPAAVIRAVFGRELPVVPRFRFPDPAPDPAPGADLLGPALAAEPDLGDQPDATVERWLTQLAQVRPPVDAWRDVLIYARAFGRDVPRPRLAQLPPASMGNPARWAGLGWDSEAQRPPSGLVSVALLGAPPPRSGQAWAGVLLDSWPELLPNQEEDAGLAFQFDAPGAQAPQAVLLAVPASGQDTWSFVDLERTLLDTLDLARIRALDLSNLGGYGQLVPMTFLAANAANAAISTSFAGLLVDAPTVVVGEGG